jgi:formyltetrahydrofolate-dependent phosphoribosylglycinamide formyltransferase
MFNKLKQRWKVNGLNLFLIITTFALGGSLCGYAGRKLLALTSLDKGAVWLVLYIVLITILWPLAVLLVSIPLGQFSFFKNYLTKVFKRLRGKQGVTEEQKAKINVAIFASGAGSNAQKIIEYTSVNRGNRNNEANQLYKIALIVCNKPEAGVLNIAKQNNIPSILIKRDTFLNGDNYLPELKRNSIDFIVLAGFLWKIPEQLIKVYPKKIINIHPALLPKYGGKGMFGHYVHEAVVANKEAESGITIHFVDELYDHGEIIFQAKCAVDKSDTADTLASKIHALEHTHYPQVIINTLQKQNCS